MLICVYFLLFFLNKIRPHIETVGVYQLFTFYFFSKFVLLFCNFSLLILDSRKNLKVIPFFKAGVGGGGVMGGL